MGDMTRNGVCSGDDMAEKGKPAKRGPAPEALIIKKERWEDAVSEGLAKKPPPGGWPKLPRKKRRGK